MKDYAGMSDFEINSAVHNALLDNPYELTFHGDGKITWKDKERGGVWETGIVAYTKNGLHDYCNNPADAWPIIVDNGITLAFQDGNWWADNLAYWVDGVEWNIGGIIDKNPLRAAMIVFLMMREGE